MPLRHLLAQLSPLAAQLSNHSFLPLAYFGHARDQCQTLKPPLPEHCQTVTRTRHDRSQPWIERHLSIELHNYHIRVLDQPLGPHHGLSASHKTDHTPVASFSDKDVGTSPHHKAAPHYIHE